MTADYPMPTPPAPPAPEVRTAWYKRKWVQLVAVGAVGIGIGGAAGSRSSSSDEPEQVAAAPVTPIEDTEEFRVAVAQEVKRLEDQRESIAQQEALAEREAAEAAGPPKASDFKLALKTLRKECFGSAGCNVAVRIDPTYTGPGELKDLEVTYEIRGGEDGAQINTFTVDSEGQASFESEQTISTASTSTRLTAVVTSVAQS